MLGRVGINRRPACFEYARYRDRVFVQRRFDLTLDAWPNELIDDPTASFHSLERRASSRPGPEAACHVLWSVFEARSP